jgi:transposase
LHLECDANGIPIHFELSPGQVHENSTLIDLLNNSGVELVGADGSPIAWPKAIAGDKGYRAEWIDQMLLELGVTPVIPSKSNEDRSLREVKFDKAKYRARNIVERVIGWLKECRAVFARFDKTAINYAGMVKMACIQRYLKLLAS